MTFLEKYEVNFVFHTEVQHIDCTGCKFIIADFSTYSIFFNPSFVKSRNCRKILSHTTSVLFPKVY